MAARLLIATLACWAASCPVRGVTPAEVDSAVQKAVQFLKSKRQGGIWENPSATMWKLDFTGGQTALATYALLAAGESAEDPEMQKAIAYLLKLETNCTYVAGLRSQVWLLLPDTAQHRAAIGRDVKFLQESMIQKGAHMGLYGYFYGQPGAVPAGGPLEDAWWDRSNSQYAVLGMWALEQAGGAVSPAYWRIVDDAWRRAQQPDSGWKYNDDGPVSPNMSLAGLATLFITQDYLLRTQRWEPCKGGISNDAIDNGLLYVDKHASAVLSGNNDWPYYGIYGVERVGVASGRKYFGTLDWYQAGADYLVHKQAADGSWGEEKTIWDASFAILFLVRGRAPVMLNKLEWASKEQHERKDTFAWNERPRDAANLAKWMGRKIETFLNWQVVNLKVPVEELHDAPILYIGGSEELAFKPEEIDKLRQFIEQGGLILGNADCGKDAFGNSFKKLGNALFPKYEFRQLPKDHPIFKDQQYIARKWKSRPRLIGLSNGVREMMLLIPDADASRAWQMETANKTEMFELGDDIFLYSVDKKGLREKGDTYIVSADDSTPAKTVKIARLEAGDNWNPEPGGWPRLANILHNTRHIGLQIDTVKPGQGKLGGFQIADLTGTTTISLNATARDEIKNFVDGGGTLVVDAAGGSPDFAASAEQELVQIFGPGAAKELAEPLPLDSPLYSSGTKIGEVGYRDFARRTIVGSIKTPRLRAITIGNRLSVIFSREDLIAGLVGEPVDGIAGYTPKSATDLMINIILYAASKAPPTTAP